MRPPEGARKTAVSGPSEFDLALADKLKETYIIERRIYETNRDGKASKYLPSSKYDGSTDSPFDRDISRREESVEIAKVESTWLKQARILRVAQIDPVDYVRRIFFMIDGVSTTPPTPHDLTSARAMDLYRQGCEGKLEDIERAWRIQCEAAEIRILVQQAVGSTAKRKVSMRKATLDVLYDRSVGLSALFRYCLAKSMKHPKFEQLAAIYEGDAATQYIRSSREYDQVWGDWITDEFRRATPKLYAQRTRI